MVVEVRSKNDRWPKLLARVTEYLNAGVSVVVVLDDEESEAHLFTDERHWILGPDDELTFTDILPGFTIAVRRFFE